MQIKPAKSSYNAGFSLMEAVVSLMVMGVMFGTVLLAYTQSSTRAQWSGMSLAAQAMAMRQLEQFRAAKWDTQSIPQVDETTNIPSPVISILDLPIAGTNAIWATNTSTVTTLQISTTPIAYVKMITVTTVWPFNSGSSTTNTLFTNTVVAYRAPDQ